MKNVDLRGVDIHGLRDFLQHLKNGRGSKLKTIENDFTALSFFYDYLVFDGILASNMILSFRRRYLRQYKNAFDDPERKLLTLEEMSRLVNVIMDPRDRAIAVLLAKTGIRRGECLAMDVDDIDWRDYSIRLKPTKKRSNRTVFFDDECPLVLKRWLRHREKLNPKTQALFISCQSSERLSRNGLWSSIVKYATRLGFHNAESARLEDHFGPHCLRHWFTTWLMRNGMPREYVKKLRGDRRNEAIDIYHHIDREDLQKSYLAFIPKLGI